jgi:hypothetical protein
MAKGDSAAPPPLCDEVVELLGSGVVMVVATRDAGLAPELVPAMGSRVGRDRRTLTVFVPRALAGATLANIERNGHLAITATRPSDHKSMQIKGGAQGVRDAADADRAMLEMLRGAMVEQLATFGMPRAITRRLTYWPSVAIDVEVNEVFVQTPGPGAGMPLQR